MVGNGFCNEETNLAACNYDGGDCCGPDVLCKWPCFFNWIVWNQVNATILHLHRCEKVYEKLLKEKLF